MRVDKTYSELWDLVHNHKDKNVIAVATTAIDTIQKLQRENEDLHQQLSQTDVDCSVLKTKLDKCEFALTQIGWSRFKGDNFEKMAREYAKEAMGK